jgi:hypothetical protein
MQVSFVNKKSKVMIQKKKAMPKIIKIACQNRLLFLFDQLNRSGGSGRIKIRVNPLHPRSIEKKYRTPGKRIWRINADQHHVNHPE